MRNMLLAALAVAALAAPATAQSVNPRSVANSIAQQISENYWSEQRGAEIATDLRQRAESGQFDRFTNERELASAIAGAINHYDHHFQVQWNPPEETPAAPQTPQAPPEAFLRQIARTNYGFVRAEMLPGGIGYLDVRSFANFGPNDADTSPARAAADAAMAMIAGSEAIIIDLRDSSGGSPAMVGYLASYFVPQDADIYNTFHSRGPDGYERPFVEPRGPRRLDTPLYILTSGRTASASESFAYTLNAANRATIVGSASAGGANPGGFIDAGNGFQVFVSGATPINPITHGNWEGDGVPLDVATTSEEALTRARILALEGIVTANRSPDTVREAQWALDAARAEGATLPARELRAYTGTYGPRTVAVENGRLVIHRDRRPALLLTPLGRDLFAIDSAAPLMRVRFDRDSRGRVSALNLTMVGGQEFRDARSE